MILHKGRAHLFFFTYLERGQVLQYTASTFEKSKVKVIHKGVISIQLSNAYTFPSLYHKPVQLINVV